MVEVNSVPEDVGPQVFMLHGVLSHLMIAIIDMKSNGSVDFPGEAPSILNSI